MFPIPALSRVLKAKFVVFTFSAVALLPEVAAATTIQIDHTYELLGNPVFFKADGTAVQSTLGVGSTLRFDSNGIVQISLASNLGSASLSYGYNFADFNDGGDVTLHAGYDARINDIIADVNAHAGYAREHDVTMDTYVVPGDALMLINDKNNGVPGTDPEAVGIFDPEKGLSGWADYSFIALLQNSVFHFGQNADELVISNGQYTTKNNLLGNTIFHLTTGRDLSGSPVPEPGTMALLTVGLFGAAAAKKRRDGGRNRPYRSAGA